MYKRRIWILLSLILVVGLTASCILDPKEDKPKDAVEPPDFKDLSEKDHVLHNLALAYNEGRYEEYDKLLDEDFTFIVSEADFNDGVIEVRQWGRDREVRANTLILNPQHPDIPEGKEVISMDLRLDYPEENWTEEPENETHPGESWYKKIVLYNLVVKTQDGWEYRAIGLQAEFTIRWAEYDRGEHWRLVLWRDDVGPK